MHELLSIPWMQTGPGRRKKKTRSRRKNKRRCGEARGDEHGTKTKTKTKQKRSNLKKVPRVHAAAGGGREGRIIYAIKEGKRREYTRTCGTMPVTSFTSSELEDYQLQPRRLVVAEEEPRPGGDQIASRFVHRLLLFNARHVFFLFPPRYSYPRAPLFFVFPPPFFRPATVPPPPILASIARTRRHSAVGAGQP